MNEAAKTHETAYASWRLALAGMLALLLAMGLGRFAQTPILPFMIEALDWSKAQAGWLASANFLGYLAGCILLGFWRIDITRTRFFLAVGLSISTTAAMALSGEMAVLCALRFLGGIASASVLVLSSALILSRLDTAGRPQLGGLLFAGVGFGIALSALLAGQFGSWGWRWLWLVCGLAALLSFALILSLMPRDRPAASSPHVSGGKVSQLARLRWVLPSYGLVGFGYVITATFISTLLRETPELQHLETTAWLVVGLTGAPSIWFWSRVARSVGTPRAYAIACVVEALGVALCVLTTDPFLLLASAAMLGGTFMGLTAIGLARSRQLVPDHAQAAIAWMSASFAFGQMAGPAFAGILAEATGSLLLPSLIAATGLLLSAFLARLPDPSPQT